MALDRSAVIFAKVVSPFFSKSILLDQNTPMTYKIHVEKGFDPVGPLSTFSRGPVLAHFFVKVVSPCYSCERKEKNRATNEIST